MKKIFGIFLVNCVLLSAQTGLAQSPTPKISGYIQFGFTEEFDSNGNGNVDPSRFEIKRARIKLRGDVTKTIRYKLSVAPNVTNMNRFMRDAYLAIEVLENHELLLGQQKTQFGYENNVSVARLYFANRAEVTEDLSQGTTVRDVGVGFIGSVKLNENWQLEDAITVVNGAGMNVDEDNTPKKNVWGRLGFRYKLEPLSLRFGVSAGTGDITNDGKDPVDPKDDIIIDFTRVGTDVQFEYQWIKIVMEYVNATDEKPGKDPVEKNGYYVNLIGKTSYAINPVIRHETIGRKQLPRNTIGAYYGKPSAKFRLLTNYESRAAENGDDRFFVIVQASF